MYTVLFYNINPMMNILIFFLKNNLVNTTENIEILLFLSVQKIIISSLITIKGQIILQSFNITMCYITEVQSRRALIPADANKCFYKLARQTFSLLFILPTLILGMQFLLLLLLWLYATESPRLPISPIQTRKSYQSVFPSSHPS